MAQISYGTITITDTTDIERIYPVYCKGGETTAPALQPLSNWSENVSQAGGSGDYIWQRIVTKKQDIAVTADDYSDAVRLTGDNGVSLTITSIQYAQTQNENDTPSYGNSMPSSINEGWWLWVKTIYSDNSEVVIKTKQGQKGDQGYSVTNTRELYYLKTNSTTVPQITNSNQITNTDRQNGWTSVVPTYVTNGSYYTCIETTLNSPTNNLKWSAPVINNALTNANQKALDAYNTSIARDTEINAVKAQAKHFWWDSEGAHIAAGQNTTSVDNITQGQPDTYTFNALTAPGFLKLRYKNIDFAQLATNSLTFYRPAVNGSTYVQGKKAMDLTADALTFYKPLAYNSSNEPTAAAQLSSTGLNITDGTIQLGTGGSSGTSSGNITLSNVDFTRSINGISRNNLRLAIGQYFGVKDDGTLYANGAVISGQITVTSGSNLSAGLGDYSTTSETQSYVTGLGYQTSSQVNSIIEGKGYALNSDLTTEINQRKAGFGTCETTYNTRDKAVTCANFELVAGNEITVYFYNNSGTAYNTYYSNSVRLNVNGKGAKDIWVANAVTSSTNQLLWGNGAYITFKYDGSKFIVIGEPRTWYGASTTPAGTAAKTDTTAVTGCVICRGAKIELAMSENNTSTSATLNIQNTGTKNIYYGNTTTRPTVDNGHSWLGTSTATFTFDGAYYRMAGQTVIDGDSIKTGTIDANRIKASVISAVNDSTETSGGSSLKISADKVNITGTVVFDAVNNDASASAAMLNSNIEIGGRNLHKDSANLGSSWAKDGGSTVADGIATIPLSGSGEHRIYQMPASGYWGIWKANTTYTISLDARADTAGLRLAISPYATSVSIKKYDLTTEWQRYSYTFTSGSSTSTASCSYYAENGSSGNVYIKNPKLEYGNKATDWSPAPEDVQAEIDTKKNVHTLLSGNSSGTDYSTILDYAKEGATGTFSVNTTSTPITNVKVDDSVRLGYYVSDMGTEGNRPLVYINATVTAIPSATQITIKAHGLDTTIIDGGNIITNSIGVNQLNTNNINNSGLLTTGALTVGARSDVLNSNIQVGGRNLFGYGSQCKALDGFWTVGAWNIATEDGYQCAHTSGAKSETRYLQSKLPFYPRPNETVAISAFVKIKNISYGTTNPMCEFYLGGQTIDGTWRSQSIDAIYVDGVKVAVASTNPVRFTNYISDTNWHHIALVRTWQNYAFTDNMLPSVYLRDATGDLYVRNIKYERGNKATDWTPAPEDVDAGIANAANTANSYISVIDGTTGISVHNASDTNNFVNVNSSGMKVYKGGNSDNNVVASFGDIVRIGKSNGARVNISPKELSMISEGNIQAFTIRSDGEIKQVTKVNDISKTFVASANDINTVTLSIAPEAQNGDLITYNTISQIGELMIGRTFELQKGGTGSETINYGNTPLYTVSVTSSQITFTAYGTTSGIKTTIQNEQYYVEQESVNAVINGNLTVGDGDTSVFIGPSTCIHSYDYGNGYLQTVINAQDNSGEGITHSDLRLTASNGITGPEIWLIYNQPNSSIDLDADYIYFYDTSGAQMGFISNGGLVVNGSSLSVGSANTSTVGIRANTTNNVDNYYIGLQFYDPGDEYGQTIRLGAGASTIVGAGESSTAIYDNNINSAATNAEGLHLSSDGAIYLYTNCNTISDRKQTTIDTNGVLSVANNLLMPDSSAIFFKDATAGNLNTIAWNASNQLVIGYGQKTGGFNTYLQGQTVTLQSNANITFTVKDAATNVYTNGYYSAAGSYSQTTSTSANLNVASGGKFARSTASSRKYKVDIQQLSASSIDAHKLYDLPVVEFKYKEGYITDTKDRRVNTLVPGFIAEDIAEIYPVAAEYINNEVEDWSFRYIIPPMLKLIQEQKQEIDELKDKVNKLEK